MHNRLNPYSFHITISPQSDHNTSQKEKILYNTVKSSTSLDVQGSSSTSASTNSSIPYMLFVYREELRKSQARLLKLSKTKLNLTQEMVSYSVDHITEYNVDELITINRQISFTRKLKTHMDQMKRQMLRVRCVTQSPLAAKRCVTS
ncbi:uncharacterized protein LOC131996027 [Stomoxys calcitrans]|uniref:uncharacterized protein LOC131996027 n=1 Tax=Stomoxys calcitrans TaxID=35570 RepID=UPI0027E34A35|nr:uncharacterized protein LOC131996027 [Stomoxys calcitrans]